MSLSLDFNDCEIHFSFLCVQLIVLSLCLCTVVRVCVCVCG